MTEAPLELGAVLIGSTPKELVSKARAVVVPTTARADAATVEAVSITLWRVGQVPSVKKLFLLQHAATAATRGGLHRSAVPNTALGTAADAQDGAVDDDDETEGAVPGEPASPPAVRERRDGHSSISGSISVGTPYNVAANDSPFSTAVRESIEAMTAPTTAPSEKNAEISSSSAELSGRSLGGKISSLFGAGRGALGKGVEIAGQLREIAKRTDHPLSPAGWAQVASPRTLPPPQPSTLTLLHTHNAAARAQNKFKPMKYELRADDVAEADAALAALVAPSLRASLFDKDFKRQCDGAAASRQARGVPVATPVPMSTPGARRAPPRAASSRPPRAQSPARPPAPA